MRDRPVLVEDLHRVGDSTVMTTDRHAAPRAVALLAAVVLAVTAALTLAASPAVADTGPAAGTRVAASNHDPGVGVGPEGDVSAGERRGTTTPQPETVVGSCVAPQTGGGGVTAVDLYATSNGKNQRPKPRPRDLGVDSSDDDVCPGSSDGISYGLSTFAREGDLITRGWVWKLPAGSPLPPGLRVEADGRDYVPGSPMPTSHHTLALTGSMSFAGAVALYQGLNWQPMGYERK